VSTGTAWALVDYSNTTIPAANVSLNPGGNITATDVQTALTVQLPLIYTTMADGVVSQLQCNGDATVYGSTTLGDSNTDTLTVNATSAFAAPVAMASTLQVTGALSSTTSIYTSGNLRVDGAVDFRGNVSLGNATTDTVTVAGPITASNNLTVTGVTQLNGTTQVNGALTTTGTVALSGTGGVTLGTNFNTTGAVGITLGGSSTVTVNSTDVTFTGGTTVTYRGTVNLFGGSNGYPVNYTRVLTNPSGGGTPLSGNLNNFLVIPGTIVAYAGTTAPSGYVVCDGRPLVTTQQPDLFAAIGYTWGGTGANFNIPDLRGMFIRGSGTNGTVNASGGGKAVGPTVGTTQGDLFGSHRHTLTLNTCDYVANFKDVRGVLAPNTDQQQTGQKSSAGNVTPIPQNGGEAVSLTGSTVETRPVNAGVLYIIKL
jgi:microcystin-dependent protein/cytoskeletal protein CcmA (bactofilin family)